MKLDKPSVEMVFEKVWCPAHAYFFRDRWPSGVAVGNLVLLQALLFDHTFATACGGGQEGRKADLTQHLLDEFSPICCSIGAESREAVYASTGLRGEVCTCDGLEEKRQTWQHAPDCQQFGGIRRAKDRFDQEFRL